MAVASTTRQIGPVQTEPNAPHPRFAIEFCGVRLPKLDQESSTIEVQNPPEVVRIQQEFAELEIDLRKSVAKAIRAEDSLENAITLRQAIESFAKMSERLVEIYREWNSLVDRVTRIEGFEVGEFSTDESKQQLQTELQKWQIEIPSTIQMNVGKSDNFVTAKYASRPLIEFKSVLERDIASKIDTVCTEILQHLIRLVDLEVIAFIEWYEDSACTYQRFTRRLEVEQVGKTNSELAMELVGKRLRKTTRNSTVGTTSRKLRRHIQHLVRAEAQLIGESKVLIPREQRTMIESLPDWLAPSIRIVEGMLIRETLVEQDLGVHTWEIKNDVVQWHNDPAIVLGPFVLSAWGPTEVQKEIEIQKKESEKVRKKLESTGTEEKRRTSPFKIAGMATLSISELFLTQIRALSVGFVVGIFLAAVATLLLALPWGVSSKTEQDEHRTHANRFAAWYAIGMVLFMALASMSLSIDQFGAAVCSLAIGGYLLILYIRASFAWDRLPDASRSV